MTRTYLACLWHHELADEPVELYSELDSERWELRKVEVYRGGRGGVAGPGIQTGDTRLGDAPCPPLEEIATAPEFEPRAITKEEFEAVWQRYAT